MDTSFEPSTDATSPVQGAPPTWSNFPHASVLNDTLPSPPTLKWAPTGVAGARDSSDVENVAPRLFVSSSGPRHELPKKQIPIASTGVDEEIANTAPPPISSSLLHAPLRTLAAPQKEGTPCRASLANASQDSVNTGVTHAHRRHEQLPPPPPPVADADSESHLVSSPASQLPTRTGGSVLTPRPDATHAPTLAPPAPSRGQLPCDGVAVLEELQHRCADLTRQIDAAEVRDRQRIAQHQRSLDAARDESRQRTTELQQKLELAQTELCAAREQCTALEAEKQRTGQERRQQREQIARLERQHQQDQAKLAAQATAHAKAIEALETDLQLLRDEREQARQRRRDEREVAKQKALQEQQQQQQQQEQLSHTQAHAQGQEAAEVGQAALDKLRHTLSRTEERAVLAESAVEALLAVWTNASNHLLDLTSHDDDTDADADAVDATTKLTSVSLLLRQHLSEEGVLARLGASTHEYPDTTTAAVASPSHLSNGASLRRVQYCEAVKEAAALYSSAAHQRETHLVHAVRTACAQLESAWATQESVLLGQLDRLTHRLDGATERLSSRCQHVRGDDQVRRTREADLRTQLASVTARLSDSEHTKVILETQLKGVNADLARAREPARIAPVVSHAAEAVRTARLSMARTMDEVLARVEQVAAVDAGKSLTDSFLVVVQTTAVKAEAQVELLARQLMKCASTTSSSSSYGRITASAFSTEARDGTKRKQVSFSSDANADTRRSPASHMRSGRYRYQSPSSTSSHNNGVIQSPASYALATDAHGEAYGEDATDSIPIGADGFPISLTTDHQRDVYVKMQQLLRASPHTSTMDLSFAGVEKRTSSRDGTRDVALDRLGAHNLSHEGVYGTCCDAQQQRDTAPGRVFCHAHHSELTALHHMARQLRNMSVLLDNHKAQSHQQQDAIRTILQDWHWTMRSSMEEITGLLQALLAEVREKQSDADRTGASMEADVARVEAPHGTYCVSNTPVMRRDDDDQPTSTPQSHRTPGEIQILAITPSVRAHSESGQSPYAATVTTPVAAAVAPTGRAHQHGGLSPAAQRLLSARAALLPPRRPEAQLSLDADTPTRTAAGWRGLDDLQAALHGSEAWELAQCAPPQPLPLEPSGAVRFRH